MVGASLTAGRAKDENASRANHCSQDVNTEADFDYAGPKVMESGNESLHGGDVGADERDCSGLFQLFLAEAQHLFVDCRG